MAAGKVITGYSLPYVAIYDPEHDTYSSGMKLGRGVNVQNNITPADDNNFCADNVVAEKAKQKFGSGDGTSTIDGLKRDAERLVYGLPAADEDGIIDFDDDMQIPYCGYGYIIRYQEEGVVTYAPMLLCKVMFRLFGDNAATQEENIDWQTQELSYDIFRSDNAKHRWKREGKDETTEAAAEAVLKTMLNITP